MKNLTQLLLGFSMLCISQLTAAVSTNQNAPDFSLAASAANPAMQFKNYQGKVIYLDFWASWCPPCAKSFPLLNQLRTKLNNPNFEIVAINVDKKITDMQKFLKKHPIDFVTAWDQHSRIPELYKIQGMPTAFIIDKKGIVRHIHVGFKRQDVAGLEQLIKQLLEE